jgi:hypothetical protein
MRAADLFRQYRKTINPPYTSSELVVLISLLFLLLVIPLTAISSQQARQLESRAGQDKETKVSTLTPGKDYKANELFIQWKPGVNTKTKVTLYKAYNLKKLKQAKGTEKYHVQLLKVDQENAKQAIATLSKNKRVEKVDFIPIPDTSPVVTTNTKVKGLASPVQAQDEVPNEVLETPEGTTIEMYTTQITAQEVYDFFKRNGLNSEIGGTLQVVGVWDSGGTAAALGYGFVDGKWIPVASIRLTASGLGRYPNPDVAHEYGHVFAHHYNTYLWDLKFDKYLEARGLLGDPRLDSKYEWRGTEIFAEDYRQLLASYEAWNEAPSQLNREIPLATEIPGLQEFLCTTYQGKSSNSWHRCQTEPDTEDPVVSITSPTDGQTVSGLVDVNVNATDNVAVEKVELRIDGDLHATDLTSPYLFSWDTTQETNDTHTLSAKAYDTSTNAATSTLVTVTVDNTTPNKPGDINDDGKVDIFDLSILLSNWGASGGIADINSDGKVDIFDLSILLTNWDG